MEWEEYQKRFLIEAKKSKKNKKYCSEWLKYAENLYKQDIPIIYTQEHFCMLVGYLSEYVYAVSNSPPKFYRKFFISKKDGGKRELDEPLPNLKDIQRWILDNILSKLKVSPYAKAYVNGRNIRENARFHRGQKKVLTLDIHNFFGSVSSYWIFMLFKNLGYTKSVSRLLAGLCCLEGHLPQGAPTSAALSNLVLNDFDNVVAAYCKENAIRYTRYADDMSFSGDFNEISLLRFIRKELHKYGFLLNDSKTRVRKQGQQQEVTGIVVNQKLQLSQKKRKKIRQELYYIKKYGVQSHLEFLQEDRKNYVEHLIGLVGYALFINPSDVELQEYKCYLKRLL